MSAPFEAPRAVVTAEEPPALRPVVVDETSQPVSAFVPLLLLGLVLFVYFVFQATQLRAERDALAEMTAAQDKPVQDSKKLRDALDVIARGTAQLADTGNPNARLIVDELKKRGVTITPNQPPGAATTTPAR